MNTNGPKNRSGVSGAVHGKMSTQNNSRPVSPVTKDAKVKKVTRYERKK